MNIHSFYIVTNWSDNPRKQMRVFLTRWDDEFSEGQVTDYTGISSCKWSNAMASQWTWTPDTERNEGMNK